MVQNDKKNCCNPYLRNHTLYDFSFMLHICEMIISWHILDLYCIRLFNTASSCKNYAKLYFDAKLLEKGLNRDTVKNVVCDADMEKCKNIIF